jgi:hypothetical protein
MSCVMGAKTDWIDGAAATVGACADGEGMEGGRMLNEGRQIDDFLLGGVCAFYEPVLAGMRRHLPDLRMGNAVLTSQGKMAVGATMKGFFRAISKNWVWPGNPCGCASWELPRFQ